MEVFNDSHNDNDWIKDQHHEYPRWKKDFEKHGYLVVSNLLDEKLLNSYNKVYSRMLDGEIDVSKHKHDLGNFVEGDTDRVKQKITQIMWPSEYVPSLVNSALYVRCRQIAQLLLGPDMEFDFDHLIAKVAGSEAVTPWHCDESYWPDMPDKRAISFWCAMQEATVDNGCMWFIPGSHKLPMREHRPVKQGHHALMCDASEDEGIPVPLPAGSCTLHTGRTLHYTRGNSTGADRRAFIVVFRPKDMIKWQRDRGYDHGKKGMAECLLKSQAVMGVLDS